jgi:4-amino-4-deoxy-L-arabinose transferase-like glycosyltransferase
MAQIQSRSTESMRLVYGGTILALIVRVAPLLRSGTDWAMDNDSDRYLRLAEGIRSGCGFAQRLSSGCASAEVLRTPGYPLFLAAIHNVKCALFVQALIGAAVCFMVGWIVAKYWGGLAGGLAALLLALDVTSIVNGDKILSDGLFQSLETAAVIVAIRLLARGKCDIVAGVGVGGAAILSGAAIMVRPPGIVLPLFIALAALMLRNGGWRRKRALVLIALAIPCTITAVWMIRNQSRTGVLTLSTDGAVTAYYYGAAGVVWYHSDKSFPEVQQQLGRSIGWSIYRYQDAPATLESAMTRRTLQVYFSDLTAAAIMTLRSFGWVAIVPDRGNLNDFLRLHGGSSQFLAASSAVTMRIRELWRSPALIILVAFQFVLSLATWIGAGMALITIRGKSRREIEMILLPFGVAIVMLAMASLPVAFARYRMPADPFLAMLAGIGYFGRFSVKVI